MIVAAVLWTIGILSTTFWQAFLLFHGGLMASAFTSEPVPLVSWLLPVISIVVVLAESTLLFPWVLQKRALCVGNILFLVAAPYISGKYGISVLPIPAGRELAGVSAPVVPDP